MTRLNARQQLAAEITPHLPGFKIIPNSRNVDVPDRKFVQIVLKTLEPAPEASGFIRAGFVVTVVTPLTTPVAAEDELDDLVADLIRAIDQLEWLGWEHAEKVTYGDRHLAYDLTVTGLIPKE